MSEWKQVTEFINFRKELQQLINRYSVENESNTPDFILANYISGCLDVFASTVKERENWYGRGKDSV